MIVSSRPMITTIVALTAISGVIASPLAGRVEQIKQLLGRDDFEWTALGDSYSSGVGAGEYQSNAYRCLRYDHAYPVQMSADSRMAPGKTNKLQNAVCSGSTTGDVQKYQMLDEETWNRPDYTFGWRPSFGSPTMATLSIGGNDIDFPGIIFNCIMEISIPIPGAGPQYRTCPDQLSHTWDLLNSANTVNNVDTTIKMIVEKGRKGPIGNDFRLYVTGFPQFFNEDTTECNTATFSWLAHAGLPAKGKDHTMMTQDLRKQFNKMSIKLNEVLADAVSRNAAQNVKWVPIDNLMTGHRFCEAGVTEPDVNNPNLYLFHWPYGDSPNAQVDDMFLAAYNKTVDGVNVLDTYPNHNDLINAVYDNLPNDNSTHAAGFWDFAWKYVGNMARVFHPQIALHEKMRDLVLDAYIKDLTLTPSIPDKNDCHGISGDYWVMSRDVAAENVKAFCGQDSNLQTYNAGSVNELLLSVTKNGDDKQKPSDAPDCVNRFTNAVLDGCDGNDPVNNPHNYKFGSTLTTGDGWTYTMKPLSKQVNEVSCDVSYKFFFDYFEIRGKNLPDAKFGANGEGLRSQLNGCGAITQWQFERTPDDVKFQWYAAGTLPIGTKGCVGRALQSAGGSGPGGCYGAGKRSVRRDSIDDWPGYGDEGRHVFKTPATKRDSIDAWPGYGDEGKHVFKNAHSG